MRMFLFGILLAALCHSPAPARASDPQANSEEKAKRAFELAKEQFEAKKFTESARLFRQAYALKKTWKLLFNIGQAEAAAGNYGLALEAFEHYLADGKDAIPPARRDETLGEIRPLREMIGDIEVTGEPGLTVLVDDVKRGILPMIAPAAVSAGATHHLRIVDTQGTEVYNRKFRVRSGQKLKFEVPTNQPAPPVLEKTAPTDPVVPIVTSIEEKASAEQPVPPEEPEATTTPTPTEPPAKQPAVVAPNKSSKGLTITGGVLLGLGTAGLIGGGISGALAISKNNELKNSNNCNNSGYCLSDESDTLESATNMATLSTILIPTGAAIATAGVVLIIVGKAKNKETNIAFNPYLDSTGSGVLVSGRF